MILTYSELEKIREKHKDQKIVICSGTFDLTHVGHILFFEDCKKLGDILVVAVGSDEATKLYKGDKRPILNQYVRLKTVDSFKPVDYTVADDFKLQESPTDFLSALFPAFEKLQPDIWVVNEDAFDIEKRKEIAAKYNMKLIVLKRWAPPEFEVPSASKIIEKVKSLD
ncbi:MAG: adenylyltransferase/cytidyltransferase family protein [Nanoarchaeota archaeon]